MSAARRFPPPWSIEEGGACFIVRDHDKQALAYVYYVSPRRASGPESVFRRGSRSLLFQLIELLFERGKARHELAIGLVAGRFFLNQVPAFGGVLLGPRPVLLGIEDLLLGEIFQRAVIFLQIEDAIARLEIKMLAVELAAEFQPAGKGLLRHARIENLALEIVDGLILRAGWGQRY
jgi:hypothetical protein